MRGQAHHIEVRILVRDGLGTRRETPGAASARENQLAEVPLNQNAAGKFGAIPAPLLPGKINHLRYVDLGEPARDAAQLAIQLANQALG